MREAEAAANGLGREELSFRGQETPGADDDCGEARQQKYEVFTTHSYQRFDDDR